jgi:hypothetical protein
VGLILREKRNLDAGDAIRDLSSGNVTWRASRLGRASYDMLICGGRGQEWGWTNDFLAIDPTFSIGYELFFSFLFLAFFDGSLQDPAKGFKDETLAVVHYAVSSSSGLLPWYTASMSASTVPGSIWGDRRRGHDAIVKWQALKRLENCSSHFEDNLEENSVKNWVSEKRRKWR